MTPEETAREIVEKIASDISARPNLGPFSWTSPKVREALVNEWAALVRPVVEKYVEKLTGYSQNMAHCATAEEYVRDREHAQAEVVARLDALVALADMACGDLAERAAHDLDHGGYRHPKWYAAVKKYRKARGLK